jgi:hypothetical protein
MQSSRALLCFALLCSALLCLVLVVFARGECAEWEKGQHPVEKNCRAVAGPAAASRVARTVAHNPTPMHEGTSKGLLNS